MNIRHIIVDTGIGEITLVAADDAVTGLYFSHHWYRPAADSFGPLVLRIDDSLLDDAAEQLSEYLAGFRTTFDLPIATRGDAFQERVWALLHEIPFGTTTTYGALAERLGDKTLAQQVGKAVGQNPLCIITPCHRVIGRDGKLTGYAGGLKRKQHLLELEGAGVVQGDKLVAPALASTTLF